jgi:glycosyltransferase involved in cell wall biosynthesis
MRLHLVALPHTQVSADFCGCAYTAKVLKFCKMMGGEHEIHLYAPDGPDVDGAQVHVPCLSTGERLRIFGPDDPNRLPIWPSDEQTALFNKIAIESIRNWIKPRDLILLSGGWTHAPIAAAFPNHIVCEPGVGYEGIFTKYCAFESYAWMHYLYGKKGIIDVRWFDRVIPNYFDLDDFRFGNEGRGKYLMFLGRLVSRKGPQIAGEIAAACNLPLYIAGAGGTAKSENEVVAKEVSIRGDIKYFGPVGVRQRNELLTGARALIVPTTYIEPFGGVAAEAMMCGTPVIATDCGAFTETVEEGITGFRFRTLAEAKRAVQKIDELNNAKIRQRAINRYSLTAVAPQYNHWFKQLQTLWGKGWYED